jgi:hypothetical protein
MIEQRQPWQFLGAATEVVCTKMNDLSAASSTTLQLPITDSLTLIDAPDQHPKFLQV